jgi:hypothetical protein
MDNVWYLPTGADAGDLAPGDLVLSPGPEEGTVLIGRVRAGTADGPEWLGDAAVEAFPDDLTTLLGSERPVAVSDEAVLRAARGIAAAEQQRGG